MSAAGGPDALVLTSLILYEPGTLIRDRKFASLATTADLITHLAHSTRDDYAMPRRSFKQISTALEPVRRRGPLQTPVFNSQISTSQPKSSPTNALPRTIPLTWDDYAARIKGIAEAAEARETREVLERREDRIKHTGRLDSIKRWREIMLDREHWEQYLDARHLRFNLDCLLNRVSTHKDPLSIAMV